jgi:outer membrane protein TolC
MKKRTTILVFFAGAATLLVQSIALADQAALPTPAIAIENPASPRKLSPGAEALPSNFRNRPLNIEDIVALTLALNPSIVSARETLAQAQGNTEAVKSNQGVSLSTTAEYFRYNNVQKIGAGGQSIQTSPQDNQTYTASASYTLDFFGKLKAATDQAKFQEIADELNVSSTQNTVVQTVRSAFYDVLRDQALVDVAQSDVDNSQANLKDAQLRLLAGTTTRYDVVSAQASVASDQKALVSGQNTLDVAFATLNNNIGLDVNTSYAVTTQGAVDVPVDQSSPIAEAPADTTKTLLPEQTLGDVKPGETIGDSGAALVLRSQNFVVRGSTKLGADYDALAQEAIKTRPEVLMEEANVEAAHKGIHVARTYGLPSISIGYTQNYTPTSITSTNVHVGESTVSASFPLWDSGYTAGKVKQAKASLSSAETARREEIDSIILEVREAYMTLHESLVALGSARTELAKADEGYRLAQLRYSVGVTSTSFTSPILELSDAQQTLSTSSKDYVNALYDYNNDKSALDKAVGRFGGKR